MKTYLKVRWHHELPNEPIVLFSEVEDGWELRKVEIFRNGRVQKAGPDGSTGDTRLSTTRLPSIEQISLDRQFEVERSTASEFENQWMSSGGAVVRDVAE
jgi:hypothetical protein